MGGLVNEQARIISNEQLFDRLFLMRLEAPRIAAALQPGQFVHMRIPSMPDHILRRPFSVYEADVEGGAIDILYQDVGYGSHVMGLLDAGAGPVVELIGPVGNRWSVVDDVEEGKRPRVLAVGGGVGAAPLFELVKRLHAASCDVDVVIGAQTQGALVTRERYAALLGTEPQCSTDDGTYGRAGFATSLVEERLQQGTRAHGEAYDYVAVCGPPPLMKIVSSLAIQAGVRCDVSLERRMACGIGACLSCVADTDEGKKRVCVDGPVFDARKVVW